MLVFEGEVCPGCVWQSQGQWCPIPQADITIPSFYTNPTHGSLCSLCCVWFVCFACPSDLTVSQCSSKLAVFHVQVIWLFPNVQAIWLFSMSKWFYSFPSPSLTNKSFAHTHTCFLFSRLGEDFKVVLCVLNQFCMRVRILNLPILINLCLLCKCSVTLINVVYSFRIISG